MTYGRMTDASFNGFDGSEILERSWSSLSVGFPIMIRKTIRQGSTRATSTIELTLSARNRIKPCTEAVKEHGFCSEVGHGANERYSSCKEEAYEGQ